MADAPSETREVQVGLHSAGFAAPDTYIIRQNGDFSLQEIQAVMDLVDGFVEGVNPLFAIIDQSQAGRVPGDARKVLLARMPPATTAVAFINVSTLAKVGLSFAKKAYLMMYGGKELEHTYVDTEAEAHQWVAQQRARLKR